MDRKPTLSIGDVLRAALENTEHDRILCERQAIEIWATVAGSGLASLTSRPTVSRGVMTIRVASAPLRQELSMRQSSLLRSINSRLRKPVITRIRFAAPGEILSDR
ncbi:MAG: DUF721 domain-containing protein [Bacteroidales bacterium]|nr:DUF721 domain-containing protein [Bacteroidales bacterium]